MLMKLADTFIYYNHVDLNISYHSGEGEEWGERFSDPTRGGRIVSVRVSPRSIAHESADNLNCGGDRPLLTFGPKTLPPGSQIIYTYSVNFVKDNSIKWSSRWDHILEANYPQSNIQWFSIFNSLIIVLFLSGMVAMILLRTLHKDILRYNQDSGEEAAEEFGWKLVHGDVFRPPRKTLLLSVLVGSGTQVLIMAAVTLVFACLGFLSPANRGSLMTCALVLYVCLGTSAGYVSARLYKSLGGERWKTNVLLTAMLCPG
ncbi:unnamed protein product [Cyprideis torosa]|uniref:Transmembrane 9 superfamily member n=1 Tax=Cyprideis torosa TaxID=163714 RepID=A0A7R8WUQ4_9CRUS|nr:unnamed protein product [Cyprideis torosa]CAG0907001.1 unnamed protein product [Cyprideis torosa]